MVARRRGGSKDRADARAARVYKLPDPALGAYDHGVGTLHVDGVLRGYLASVVLEMQFPSRQPWVWFVIVWADGRREFKFEDYGPGWYTVRELDARRFDHFGPSVPTETRFLWMKTQGRRPGPPTVYDFAWLPAGKAAAKWRELALADSDF